MFSKDSKDKAFAKVLATLTSTKYHVLITSSLFFWHGTLTESGYITLVLGTLGYHTANEIYAMKKGSKK